MTLTLKTLSWLAALALSVYASTCAHAAPVSITVVDETGQAVPVAAVSVYVKGVKPQATQATADMAQKARTFVPSLLVVQTGTAVNFPNFDTVRHHVYSFSGIKKFELKLYSGTPTAPIVFDKAGTATLGCNIHDKMLSVIHVVDTPYFGITSASGQVSIDMPSGEHRIHVWTTTMGEATAPVEQTFKTGAFVVVKIKR